MRGDQLRAEVIARHRRSYDSEDLIFDPLHYLPLIEQKIGALDQAAPLAGWDLPEAFITLRRLLEARMGKAGKREYVQVLRLLETFRLEEVEGAVGDALRLGAIGFDAVKHLVLCRIERRPPRAQPRRLSVSAARPGRDDVRQVVHEPAVGARRMTDTPQVLLAHHLKTLKLPTFLREYDKIARQCASEGVDHVRYLLRLAELELIDRERRMVERRIKAARFPVGQEPRQLRLQGHPLAQQGAGPGAGPLRVHRAPREPHRARQQWDRQDPHRPRSRLGGLPEGPLGRLHHRRRAGPRTHRGPAMTSSC